jgi:hypothetical protein
VIVLKPPLYEPFHTHGLDWRFVCARRARKLRRRGEHVRYCGRTSTGKALYRWLPAA